jgi:hypothetical protein
MYDIVVCHTREGARTVGDCYRLAGVDAGAGFHIRSAGANPCVRATGVDNQVVCNDTLVAACFLSIEPTGCGGAANANCCDVAYSVICHGNASSTTVESVFADIFESGRARLIVLQDVDGTTRGV